MVARRTAVLAFFLAAAITMPVLAGCVTHTIEEPSDVKNLRVIQHSEGGARLLWDEDPRGTAHAFQVHKNGVHVATVYAPSRSWTDDDVTPDEEVTYRVAAALRDGSTGSLSAPVSFTYREALTVTQEAPAARGHVNFTVIQATSGLRWADISLRIDGEIIPRDDIGYGQRETAWTHANPRDPFVDREELILVYAPGAAVRNATIDFQLRDEKELDKRFIEARPTLNLTLQQSSRNATDGLAALTVQTWAWQDRFVDVTNAYPDLAPRWNALEVYVNGTRIPYNKDARAPSWSHERPQDAVLRTGERLTLNAPGLVGAGSLIVVYDAVAQEESFRIRLR